MSSGKYLNITCLNVQYIQADTDSSWFDLVEKLLANSLHVSHFLQVR